MNYQIRQEQKMSTFRTLAKVENNGLTTIQILMLNNNKLPSNIYNKYNQLYNSVTYAYSRATDRARKDTNKLLTSIPEDSENIYLYKILIDKGSNTELTNIEVAKDEYINFNNTIIGQYRAINRKYYRSNKKLTIQISNTATEHAIKDNFTRILLHNHALLLTNEKLDNNNLTKIISNKLPTNFNVQIQEFNKYKSNEQLVINSSNKENNQVITSLKQWLTYIYKTVAQKPFKNYVELNKFELLPLEQRYKLIRTQQLITKGIRKHKSLTIHFNR